MEFTQIVLLFLAFIVSNFYWYMTGWESGRKEAIKRLIWKS